MGTNNATVSLNIANTKKLRALVKGCETVNALANRLLSEKLQEMEIVSISQLFIERIKQYQKEEVTISCFKGSMQDVAAFLFDTPSLAGSVEIGEVDNGIDDEEEGSYISIHSKVGGIFLYMKNDGTVHYIVEKQYADCHTAIKAGFGQTSGQITSVDMLKHLFAIPDSYL